MSQLPSISATNAFYYYEDVERAHTFYRETMGFETIADYGFAKIMRIASNSYLTLVDVALGMHSIDEPKSVAIALVTEQVQGWWDYLKAAGVEMRSKSYAPKAGSNHDGFVALDPEGYFIEVEQFNVHPENEELLPHIAALPALGPAQGSRPDDLKVQATVLWLYTDELAARQQFYETLFGVECMVDQGWAKVYQMAGSGFLGLVDGAKGMHQATERHCVTISFFTEDVAAWAARAKQTAGFVVRTKELLNESDRVTVFVGYDPEGYFLEWDTFLDVAGNEKLLAALAG